MLVARWMTSDPVSVLPKDSLSKCRRLLKERGIRRLPVVDEEGRLLGIVSDRDVKSASPSPATSLEVHEMQYLLAEVRAKDIMTPAPLTVAPEDSVLLAARHMLDAKIGGLPVVDGNGRLVGIITDQDLFRAVVSFTGARIGGLQAEVEIGDEQGSLMEVIDSVRRCGGRIITVMTSQPDGGGRRVFLRLRPMAPARAEALRGELRTRFLLSGWAELPPSRGRGADKDL